MKSKKKYLIVGIISVSLILIGGSIFLKQDVKKEEKGKTISQEETKSMLSYTIDGVKTDIKPTKGSGYIANKIICENGSNLVWDNTNWEVEIIKLESNDICTVDFTTNTSTSGYRVTATTNVEGSIDSLSKATIENGTIIFYPNKGQEITGVSGCSNGKLENNKVIVSNVTSNQTCNIEVKKPTLYSVLTSYNIGERGTFDMAWGASNANSHASITQGYNQEKTIYKTGSDYYFAGNPSDNWMNFAGFWWRIIRTNSSEGTRLLYAGKTTTDSPYYGTDTQNGYISGTNYAALKIDGLYRWHTNYYLKDNVQWTNASFKDALTNWYNNNIIGINDDMVNDDTTYCNDINVVNTTERNEFFQSYGNIENRKIPSYVCVYNGNVTHKKVGLMTADEVAYAGGLYGAGNGYESPNTYYYRNSYNNCIENKDVKCSVTGDKFWWTMSPSEYWLERNESYVFTVYGASSPGGLSMDRLDSSRALRPVVTLRPEVLVTGSGTIDDPFIPSLN